MLPEARRSTISASEVAAYPPESVAGLVAPYLGEDAPAPKTLYEPGEVVRVCDGPFNDFNGVVENVDYERNIVKVSVQILGRATPVELDFLQIEKT